MNGHNISQLLESGSDFGEVVKSLQPQFNFTQFVEDDSPDEYQSLVNSLQEFGCGGSEVWSQGDFTLYHEGQAYRLCQADMGGHYSIYLW